MIVTTLPIYLMDPKIFNPETGSGFKHVLILVAIQATIGVSRAVRHLGEPSTQKEECNE